ncbi:protein SLC31A2 [Brachyhypopomus gauderio]|uniref:protein SLC31A2 n=1 Tax=Brachyhypopomus gauderio TaxID=698409 RepID=UPI004042B675
MSTHFEGSSNVTLLFDFWNVHGPGGMVLSVFVVLLLTVIYELLKVWKTNLQKQSEPSPLPPGPAPLSPTQTCFPPVFERPEIRSSLTTSPSEVSLTPRDDTAPTVVVTPSPNAWLLHSLQTGLHVVQVVLGYMLMLCVMSYNVWIFSGVMIGSALGYFLTFPLLGPGK